MSCYDEDAYIKKCPICGQPLEHEDIDYNFDGNQNELACCSQCHVSFEFYIRYHHLWKYTKWNHIYHQKEDIWECDDEHSETIYVWKGGKHK